MRTLFSTADEHPRHRFDYWHDVACKRIVRHASTPQCRATFQATIHHADVGGLDLIVFENEPMFVARTSRIIAQSPDDSVLICRQSIGTVHFEQDSRQLQLTAGDLAVLDPQRPYTANFQTPSRMLVMKIPRAMLEARVGHLCDVTIRKLSEEGGIGAVVSDHLAAPPGHATLLDARASSTAAAYTLDLIAMAVVKVAGAARKRTAARSLAAFRLRAFIDARLSDPTLCPISVAGGIGLSVRYAHALLAESGTSIVRLIQSRRLEQIEMALADPAQAHRTVGEIAFAWGFSDLTHFGRLFKKRFGATPRDYRRCRLAELGRPEGLRRHSHA